MKNFKKFIREAHLGNPLNEEDRATRVDRIFAGDIEIPEFDPEDVLADLAREEDEEINEENEKYDHIARAEYGKPFSLLSIAQKQEMLSYMNRETEKEFETDFERRRKGDYSDDRDDGMTDYQRRRMDEALDPKDFPANFFYGGKIYVFDRIAGGDRAVYYNPKYKGDNLVFGSKKQMEDYLDDYVEPKGGTQSSNFGESLEEDINESSFASDWAKLESGDIVNYKGEDHTIQRIEDDDLGVRIYIRPNEKSYYGGRKDTFWVKPKDLNENINENTLGDLVKKYGKDLINFVIDIDELTKEEIKDVEYLDDRIQIHLEEPEIRQRYLPEDNGGAKQDITLNINNPGAESHALDAEVNDMGYSESLQESLRKKLQERLK